MLTRKHSILAALLLVALAAPAALAQDAKPDKAALAKARQHYLKATQLMGEAAYEQAAAEFQGAYEITKDPVLHFKVGQAYEKASKWGLSADAYNLYITEKPSAKDKAEVETKIADLRKKQAELDASAEPPMDPFDKDPDTTEPDTVKARDFADEPPMKPGEGGAGEQPVAVGDDGLAADAKPRGMRTAAWLSVGLAAAFATTGGVLALSASSRADDLERLQDQRDQDGRPLPFEGNIKTQYEELEDEGETLSTLSLVFFGAAGLATGAAVTFFILDGKRGSGESEAPAPSGGPATPPVTLKLKPILSPTVMGFGATLTF